MRNKEKNMAWYNFFTRTPTEEKLNPSQTWIARDEGTFKNTTENFRTYAAAYEQLEVVNRAVNMIVDDVSEIPTDVGEKLGSVSYTHLRAHET